MRIALDISGIFAEKVGINTYIEGLLRALSGIDKINDYFLYASFFTDFKERIARIDLPLGNNFHPLFRRFPQKISHVLEWGLGYRAQEKFLLNSGIDVLHGTGNLIPRTKSLKSVVTNHGYLEKADLQRYWTTAGKSDELYFKDLVRLSLYNSNKIIAVSKWTKDGIVDKLGIKPEKIDIVEIGVNECFRRAADKKAAAGRVGGKYGFDGSYIVLIGHNPKKRNIKRILESFAKLMGDGDTGQKLVIANGKQMDGTGYCREIGPLWEKMKHDGRIVLTGTLSLEDMNTLYNGADLLVYPSLMEGFGIPIIEAMACGCPVITSAIEPMAGITGDAGLLVDPYNSGEIAEAMRKVLTDECLREELIKKGLRQVKKFSWERAAEKTLGIYKQLHGTK